MESLQVDQEQTGQRTYRARGQKDPFTLERCANLVALLMVYPSGQSYVDDHIVAHGLSARDAARQLRRAVDGVTSIDTAASRLADVDGLV